jgi:hypothetical protein
LPYSQQGGAARQVPDEFIANPNGLDAGNPLDLTAPPDGNFDVFQFPNPKDDALFSTPNPHRARQP